MVLCTISSSMMISINLNLFSIILLLLLFNSGSSFDYDKDSLKRIPSVFPHRLNYPGLEAPMKVWWTKEITPDFHISGRLSDRQIKYASEAGFKSIVSLFTYPSEDFETSFGGVPLLNTEDERRVVEEVAGLQFQAVLDPMDEWASVEAVAKFTAIAPTLKTPVLLHCDRGHTMTFVLLLYMANQTLHNAKFEPKIRSKEFFEITAAMGYDFFSRIPLEVVSEITREPLVHLEDENLPRPNSEPKEWMDYWLAQPVYRNWFIAGQIYASHVKLFEEFGYKSVVNIRGGLTYNGNPWQEEVNLLNIKGFTGTYGDSNTPPRQSEERLLETRVNPDLPNSYISNTSNINYERINEDEFGDNIGYNAELQEKAFKNVGLKYYHLPYYYDGELSAFSEFYATHKDTLLKIGQDGPVLVQCAIGLRAATVAVLTAAIQYNFTFDWAVQRLKELSFGPSQDNYSNIFKVYRKYLMNPDKTEL